MIQYYGYTISPNQIETGEGFLICRNVPVARIGDQEYLGSEIGLDGADAGKVITVHRRPEEVFAPEALASFEGKPVTDDHPPFLLDPDNVSLYLKGHAEQIRKGSGDWDGYVIADLHIQDRTLIEAIQNGKREVSCGYECDYVQEEDGTYSQKNIRGNHIAVVERGRAGKRAAILDSNTIYNPVENPPERKVTMRENLLKLLAAAINGKTPEEVSQIVKDTAAAMDEGVAPPAKEEPAKEPATADPAKNSGAFDLDSLDDAALDGLLEKLLARKAAKEAAEKQADGDPMEKAIAALAGENSTDPEGAHVVPAEEMDQGTGGAAGMDKALAAGILKAMRPVVAGIKDEKQRTAVSDALIKCVTAQDGASDIAKIMQAAQKNAQKAADSRPDQQKMYDQVQALYDARNPHKAKKEEK